MKKNQEIDRAKIGMLETQVGNIPKKLKEYEQGLWLLIKGSGKNMEQVTSSLCAVAESFRKKTNEEIMSLGGPSKRTRLSSWKKVVEVTNSTGFSTLDIIFCIVEVGKETARMIKELQ